MGRRKAHPAKPRHTPSSSWSPENLEKLQRVKAKLGQEAKQTIDAQLKRPKAPVATVKARAWTPMSPAPVSKPPKRGYALVKPKVTFATATVETGTPKVRPSSHPPKEPANGSRKTPPFKHWDLPPEASVREAPPSEIAASDRDECMGLVERGGFLLGQEGLDELFAYIGLDFGTSCTKVIVRFPFEAGQPTVAVPAPRHCRSQGEPYLWQTVVWMLDDGSFSVTPEPGAKVMHTLKQGLMGANAFRPALDGSYRGLEVTRVDAAAAYLAYVVRYVRGWIAVNRPQYLRGRNPIWAVNVGLPAEHADSERLSRTYRQVAAAALQIANHGGPIDIETTKLFLDEQPVKDAAADEELAARLGIAIVPETAAEAAGFAKSSKSAPDLYLMVDVGAMTLDVCTFNFTYKAPGEHQYALLSGTVRSLGVEAMHWYFGEGRTEDQFREQCSRTLQPVVWDTFHKKYPGAPAWHAGSDMPVFLVGGGAANGIHRETVEALGPWLKKYTGNEGIRFVPMPDPSSLDLPEPMSGFGRLAVAWGLSYPADEIGQILPLSASEDVPPLPERDNTGNFVSKEWV